MNISQIKEIVLTGTPEQVQSAVGNRKEVTQIQMKALSETKLLREDGLFV